MDKYLLVSDVHLTSTNIVKRDNIIYRYLKKYLDDGFKIILVGDIHDIIINELMKFKREYKAIKACYPKTTKLIETSNNIIYIKGNHDAVLERFDIHPNIRDDYDINFCNYKIHIEHGHMYDLPNGKCHCIGDCVSRIWGCCKEQINDEDFLDKVESIDQINKSHKKLKKAAKKLDANMVIFGHTHKRYFKSDHLNKVYVNTGVFNKEGGWIDETQIFLDHTGNKLNKISIKQREKNINDIDNVTRRNTNTYIIDLQ